MNTFINFRKIATVAILGFALTIGTLPVNAQGHGKGNRDRENNLKEKEWKHDNRSKNGHNGYRPESREFRRDRNREAYNRLSDRKDYREYKYSRHAPWGKQRPLTMSHRGGKVYFYRGHYYEYHPNRGYIMINIPLNYVFNDLPYGSRKVWVDGHSYYRHEDIFFKPSVNGYVVIPAPSGITITARF